VTLSRRRGPSGTRRCADPDGVVGRRKVYGAHKFWGAARRAGPRHRPSPVPFIRRHPC
jgi:hypothetical protein